MVSEAECVLPPFRVILQARTTSTRLPAKALLPVGGMPLTVLAALRATRNGADVVVATSDEAEDDLLARILIQAGLRVMRGPLKDVLARFLMATADLPDTAICVRLTSDNPFPNADFVETLVAQFVATGARYLAYGDGHWLPYGLSAEAFHVGALRVASATTTDAYVREHVTPSIRAEHASAIRPPFPDWFEDLGHLRCTIDTLQDYLVVAELFEREIDPVAVPFRALVARMAKKQPKPPPSLILGTAQLGLPYGVARAKGLMPESEAREILTTAAQIGCRCLDTARAYGDSEMRIGRYLTESGTAFHLITKLAPFDIDDKDDARLTAEVENSIAESCRALNLDRLECALLHRATHVKAADGVIWHRLISMQNEGRVGRLGVSVQTPEELEMVLRLPEVSHVQFPYNPIDWRWEHAIAHLRSRPDVTTHVRSVFLQGLLVQPTASSWPVVADVDGEAILGILRRLARDLDRKSVSDLCVAYIRAFSWVDGLVIGVDSAAQLRELSDLFARPALTWPEVVTLRTALPRVPEQLLDPARWPQRT